MKDWKGYNLLDLFLILIGLVTVNITGIIFLSPWYIIVATNLGLFCVFTQAKGKIITQFLGVIYFSMYLFISYTQKYYGEALVYLIFMLPMYFYGIVHWLKNKDKENHVVLVRSNLSKKEWIFLSCACACSFIFVYFLLKQLNTEKLILNVLSFATVMPAIYLLARRCKWNQVAFLINDLIAPILWLLLVVEGDYSFLPMFIYHLFQLIYDFYGLIEWIKLEKKQKQENVI